MKMSQNVVRGVAPKYTINFSLGDFFFNSATNFSDKTCQIDAIQDQKESYVSVKQRSTRVALELQKRNISSKDVIVFCTSVTLDNIIPILASFYLGAKVANLDPSLSTRQTTHLLSLVSPSIIFVEESSLLLIEESLSEAHLKAEIVVFGKSEKYSTFTDFLAPKKGEDQFKPIKIDIHDTAIIFFSSGTTGLPKAICHSHYSFLHVAHSFNQSGARCDVVLSFSSFYWVSGLLLLTCSFINGGHRVFCGVMEAEKTFKTIEKYKITYVFLAPILTYKLTNFEEHQKYNTSSLRTLLVAGTPISPTQFQRLRELFRDTNIIFFYGQTEAGMITLFDPETDSEFLKSKIGSAGKVAVGFTVKVVDLKNGKILGANQKGEICVKSPTVMKAYYNADSSEAFDDESFLKTGDIGFYDKDGCFYVIERLKEMFKFMSWHIVPSAIEQVLLEHPFVKEAVVFGIPRSEEEGEVPAACIIVEENCNVSKEAIEEFVAARVSDYERLRGGVIFVKNLLKTPSGKLMRKEIRNNFLSSIVR